MADDDIWAAPGAQRPAGAQQPTPAAGTPAAPPQSGFGPAQPSSQPGAQYPTAPSYPPPAPPGEQPGGDKHNWMGILAVIFPFVGMAAVGIVFGHLGLSANKRGTANNRDVALAGTIVSWVVTAFAALLIGLGIIAAVQEESDSAPAAEPFYEAPDEEDREAGLSDPDNTTFGTFTLDEADGYLELYYRDSTEPGTCLNQTSDLRFDLEEIACDQPHVAEIYVSEAVGPIAGTDDATSEVAQNRINDLCWSEYEAYVGTPYEDSEFHHWYFLATADDTFDPDDSYICVVSSDFTELDGMIAGSAR